MITCRWILPETGPSPWALAMASAAARPVAGRGRRWGGRGGGAGAQRRVEIAPAVRRPGGSRPLHGPRVVPHARRRPWSSSRRGGDGGGTGGPVRSMLDTATSGSPQAGGRPVEFPEYSIGSSCRSVTSVTLFNLFLLVLLSTEKSSRELGWGTICRSGNLLPGELPLFSAGCSPLHLQKAAALSTGVDELKKAHQAAIAGLVSDPGDQTSANPPSRRRRPSVLRRTA